MTQRSRVGVSAAVLAAALLVPALLPRGEAVPIRKSLDAFPLKVGTWHAREGSVLEPVALSILQPKDYLIRRDEDHDGHSIWLFIAYWDSQRRGAQPHSPKNCLPGAGWEPVEASRVTIALPHPASPIIANRYLIQKERTQQVVLYWYQSQGKAIAGELAARMEMVKSSMLRQRTDGALVRVSSPVHGTVRDTSDRLTRYVQALYPTLGEFLPE